MAHPPDKERITELLAQLDQVTEESQDLLRRIADLRGQVPEWPDRRPVAELFSNVTEPSHRRTRKPDGKRLG